jgi:hypothetical protein
MHIAALLVLSVTVCDATRSLRSKPHHEALLATSETEGEQLSTRTGISEKMAHLESQTNQLLSFINEVEDGLSTAFMQLDSMAHPANATKAVPAAANTTGSKPSNVTKVASGVSNKTEEAKPQNATKPASVASNVTKAAVVNLKKLAPAEFKKAVQEEQDVLANLFKHLKVNIASFNKQETKDKDKTAAIRKRLEERLKKDKATLAMKNISDFERERLTNSTRMEQHELDYWNRDRDLQHHMFHSNLKMTHGLMSRVKTVIEAYKEVSSKGKIDGKLMEKVHAMGPTKAAFLEMRKDVRERAHTYKVHLRLGLQISHPPHRESGSLI